MNLPFKIQEFSPIEALQPYVSRWVFFEFIGNENYRHKIPPAGKILLNHAFKCNHPKLYKENQEITYNDKTLFVGHPLHKDVQVEFYAGLQQVVCEFKTEGFYPLFHFSVDQLMDKELGINSFGFDRLSESLQLGNTKEEVKEIMESFLLDRLTDVKEVEQDILEIIQGFSEVKMTTFEYFKSMSPAEKKKVYRKFRKYIGLSPKQFYRISQLNLAIRLLNQQDVKSLTELGLKAGYYDQSAFIKHLQNCISQSPSWLINNKHEVLFKVLGGPNQI